MRNRQTKAMRKIDLCDVPVDMFIERLRKVRALNCDPSDVGLDDSVWRDLSFQARRANLSLRTT